MSESAGVPMLADAPVLRRVPPIGPHPLRIASWAAFTQVRKVRRRALRATYARRVGSLERVSEIVPVEVRIREFDELPGELRVDAERIRAEADAILDHRVRYLGSGDVDLGESIDWHLDFKSGYRWQPTFYMDLEVTRLDDDSDAKVPWELSRGHQLLTLARAWRLHGDDRYVREIEAQLASWIDANPPGYGINWVNAMEVGIRAVNWLWVLGTLEGDGSRPLDPALRERVARVLLAHGRHIATNLEGTPFLRSNHYLSDLLGLLAIGACLPGDPRARRWGRFAQRRFEAEIREQVLADGVSFEASLPYHGLVLEIFLLSLVLAEHVGKPFSAAYVARVGRMLELSAAVRHANGRVPVFGDNDSGRVLPGGFDRPPTHDPQLWLGAAVLEAERPLAGPVHAEVAWTLGVDAWRAAGERPARSSGPPCAAFRDGGIYVMEGAGTKLVVRCGDVGQHGNGGHAHNDLLSYELSHEEAMTVVDSGTYAYTFDLAARNELRSTRAHNIVMVDGQEINPIPAGLAFKLAQTANPAVRSWSPSADKCVLVAEHDGYRRLASPVVHRRTFELDRATGTVTITDELLGSGEHEAESFIHLAPGAEVTVGPTGASIRLSGRIVDLTVDGIDEPPQLAEGWVADRYGVRERAPVLNFRRTGPLPARVTLRITPSSDGAS